MSGGNGISRDVRGCRPREQLVRMSRGQGDVAADKSRVGVAGDCRVEPPPEPEQHQGRARNEEHRFGRLVEPEARTQPALEQDDTDLGHEPRGLVEEPRPCGEEIGGGWFRQRS